MAVHVWSNVRIKRETAQRLRALIAVLSGQDDGGWKPELRHDGTYLSFDDAITILLDRDEAHRARAKRVRSKRREGLILQSEVTLPSES